jgi:hypothetical protein
LNPGVQGKNGKHRKKKEKRKKSYVVIGQVSRLMSRVKGYVLYKPEITCAVKSNEYITHTLNTHTERGIGMGWSLPVNSFF